MEVRESFSGKLQVSFSVVFFLYISFRHIQDQMSFSS